MAFSVFGDQSSNKNSTHIQSEMNWTDWKYIHVHWNIDCMWHRINTYSTKLGAIHANSVREPKREWDVKYHAQLFCMPNGQRHIQKFVTYTYMSAREERLKIHKHKHTQFTFYRFGGEGFNYLIVRLLVCWFLPNPVCLPCFSMCYDFIVLSPQLQSPHLPCLSLTRYVCLLLGVRDWNWF